MEGLTDSLRRELRPSGIEVSIIRPGPDRHRDLGARQHHGRRAAGAHAREAQEHYGPAIAGARAGAAERMKEAIPPQEVAEVVAHALTADKPRTRYLVGPRTRLMALFATVPAGPLLRPR